MTTLIEKLNQAIEVIEDQKQINIAGVLGLLDQLLEEKPTELFKPLYQKLKNYYDEQKELAAAHKTTHNRTGALYKLKVIGNPYI